MFSFQRIGPLLPPSSLSFSALQTESFVRLLPVKSPESQGLHRLIVRSGKALGNYLVWSSPPPEQVKKRMSGERQAGQGQLES